MGWSTTDEIALIDGLGTHCVKLSKHDDRYRLKLLKGYLASIPNRVDWGRMDKRYITDYVKRQLSMEVQE